MSLSKADLWKSRSTFIKDHRKIRRDIAELHEADYSSNFSLECSFRNTSSAPGFTNGNGLMEINLKEIDSTKTFAYIGRYIQLTLIDDPMLGLTSVNFVVEDKNKDVAVLSIYGIPHDQSTWTKYGFGTIISVANPFVRISPVDGRWGIRVDDVSSVTILGKKDCMCRYCGEEGATKKCGHCKRNYCDRECQVADWEHLDHKKICKLPSS